jgi:GNAT superfamily N-acetyltransferase
MVIVDCIEQYWEFVRLLRTDNRVLDGFVEKVQITKEQQILYMRENWQNYRICLIDGIPVGYVGVIEDDIRVCTHPEFQNMGVGKFMINECKRIWPNSYAKVKLGNTASERLFLSCGFKQAKKDLLFTYFQKNNEA